MSTRELARRAGISQAYVVALERSRNTSQANSPAPTVDVLARLAAALRIEPTQLFAAALRQAGQHVLLVVEDHHRSVLDHARVATCGEIQTWVWAASSAGHTHSAADGLSHINLRRSPQQAYAPAAMKQSLTNELRPLGSTLDGRDVGFVFAETSSVMSALDDPHAVISFEHEWAEVVDSAATLVGAHAAFNICVYELDALHALHDSVEATVDLMRSHSAVWVARQNSVLEGASAARRILSKLRPPTITPTSWRSTTKRLIDDLGLVA